MEIKCECGCFAATHQDRGGIHIPGCDCVLAQSDAYEAAIAARDAENTRLREKVEAARMTVELIKGEVMPPPVDYIDEEAEWNIVSSDGAENIYHHCTELLAALDDKKG